MRIALIVGGAETWQAELDRAKALCAQVELPFELFILNDHIADFPEPVRAVTLHPNNRLGDWMRRRKEAGLPALLQVWAHHSHPMVTDQLPDWGGSVGLLACKIAIYRFSHKKIMLCGVPMTVAGGHYVRHQPWAACPAFRRAWLTRKNEIAPYVRSMSGWTAETFGQPTVEWLLQ